ncbi:ATP-dependent DNA helicase Q1 [Patella vulgata]|uniref:ATP-dependent DNA helicase Q1 n=1 Tax=Patella vulgata TaxID=6465 RepID=UPI00217F234D|nr:ATP-dependent DNA helicase Q1 [Patella vulgata]
MDAYRENLRKVKEELTEVEVLLQDLLDRQSSLLQQKDSLEKILREHSESSKQDTATDWNKNDFSWSSDLDNKLKSVFKLDKLRAMQLQTMNVTLSGKDCMLIMPTGGGKSLCFQLPAVVSKGITLVVSPLISLMEDQLMALEALDIHATTLNSSTTTAEAKSIFDAMTNPKATLKLLYVTPEKLAKSKRFMNKLEKMYQVGRFARLVIDEVHCCSQWGHDFRPDYKFLGIMKRQFPEVPILGLTATATVNVLEDVKKILNIPKCQLFRASFNRPNLYYQVRPKPATQVEALDEIQKIIQSRFNGQSGIVYCFSRKDSEEVTSGLQKRGIRSGCYHANLSSQERSRIHHMWSTGQVLVVVATIAFGMGIDKPNVRFVIHHSISKSMENLYQESGRAGRDEQKSECIVFYRLADIFRQSTMVFTEQTGLKCLYGILAYCLDSKRCRRSMIAQHFGESWDASQCDGMCDHCDLNSIYTSTTIDITNHCKNVLAILKQASETDQRVTALKLVDSWFGKGQASLKVKDIKVTTISKEKADIIIGYMLLNGYLKEDFHFTAYTTISYILPGPKANLLLNGNRQISFDFKVKALGATKTPKSSQASTKTPKSSKESPKTHLSSNSTMSQKLSKESTSKQTLNSSATITSSSHNNGNLGNVKSGKTDLETLNKKPKLVVINRENSQLSSFTTDHVSPNKTKSNNSKSFHSKGNNSKIKKRKPVISDSDSDGLDFGELSPPKKKAFKNERSKNKPNSQDEKIVKGSNSVSKQVETGGLSVNGSTDSVPICIGNSDSDFDT